MKIINTQMVAAISGVSMLALAGCTDGSQFPLLARSGDAADTPTPEYLDLAHQEQLIEAGEYATGYFNRTGLPLVKYNACQKLEEATNKSINPDSAALGGTAGGAIGGGLAAAATSGSPIVIAAAAATAVGGAIAGHFAELFFAQDAVNRLDIDCTMQLATLAAMAHKRGESFDFDSQNNLPYGTGGIFGGQSQNNSSGRKPSRLVKDGDKCVNVYSDPRDPLQNRMKEVHMSYCRSVQQGFSYNLKEEFQTPASQIAVTDVSGNAIPTGVATLSRPASPAAQPA